MADPVRVAAAGCRWVVYRHYENSAVARTGVRCADLPHDYMVASRDLSMRRGPYETLAEAEREAEELNRFDVQGPLDPEFEARRDLLKKLTPYARPSYCGPPGARWPVRPARYFIDGLDQGHGEGWEELVDTLDEVKAVLTGELGHEVLRVVDLDTGDEVGFERRVSVELIDQRRRTRR